MAWVYYTRYRLPYAEDFYTLRQAMQRAESIADNADGTVEAVVDDDGTVYNQKAIGDYLWLLRTAIIPAIRVKSSTFRTWSGKHWEVLREKDLSDEEE
jgi:hypothetical protein